MNEEVNVSEKKKLINNVGSLSLVIRM